MKLICYHLALIFVCYFTTTCVQGRRRRRSRRNIEIKYIRQQKVFHDHNFGDGKDPWYESNSSKHQQQVNSGRHTRLNSSKFSRQQREEIASEYFGSTVYNDGSRAEKNAMIIRMQRKNKLQRTGILDDETIKLMQIQHTDTEKGIKAFSIRHGMPRWNKAMLTYKILGYTTDIDPCVTRNIIRKSFRLWEEEIMMNFTEVHGDTPADIDIKFAYGKSNDYASFDGADGILAYAWAAGSDPISGDMYFDDSEMWTLGYERVSRTYEGNSAFHSCVFPFIYKNKEYTSCTRDDNPDEFLWCSTTSNFDKDGKYGLCPSEELFTYGGNSDGARCVFPFKAKGKWYEKCTKDGKIDRYRWCSTTSNFEEDGKWGYCPDRLTTTEGGDANGDYCHFPYKYNGHVYNDCTTMKRSGRDDDEPWCLTTSPNDRYQKWGYCKTQEGYNLLHVAAHEIGHVLGLRHSTFSKAVMYGNYIYNHQFQLNKDDIHEALKLYEKRTTKLDPLELELCYRKYEEIDGEGKFHRHEKHEFRKLNDVDSIFAYGMETCVVKDSYVWRTAYRFDREIWPKPPPNQIKSAWVGAPNKFDTAFRLERSGQFWIFQGKRYWRFDNGVRLSEGFPKSIEELGFSQKIIRINAALVRRKFEGERTVYFFSGKHYYRFDVKTQILGLSRPITDWDRRLKYIDGTMEHPTIKDLTLFFKKKLVYVFHNRLRRVVKLHYVADWLRLLTVIL